MRKDLWIGGTTAALVHGTAILFSVLHPANRAPHSLVEDVIKVMAFPPPPPELVEPPVVDSAEEPRPNIEAPPSLNEVVQIKRDSPFTQPIQPPPLDVPHGPIIVIPIGPGGPGQGDAPFDLSDLSQAPVAVSRTNPIYPFALRRDGVEGQVIVDFIVDEHGNVLRPYALEGGRAEFGQAAVEGVKRWHFRPGIKDGKAVRTHMQIPLVFSIQPDN